MKSGSGLLDGELPVDEDGVSFPFFDQNENFPLHLLDGWNTPM